MPLQFLIFNNISIKQDAAMKPNDRIIKGVNAVDVIILM